MKSQCQTWLDTAKRSLKENTIRRSTARIDKLEQVINTGLSPYAIQFVIDETLKKKIMHPLFTAIDAYSGTRKLMKDEEVSLQAVVANTRMWWNRHKPLKLGSCLFSVICFSALHHFVHSQVHSLSSRDKLLLFIDIFISFMDETITFPKTKPKPLVVQQCFLRSGNFNTLCCKFITIFGEGTVKWHCGSHENQTGTKYIKKKNRTQSICDEFYRCLHEIKYKWSRYDPNTNHSANLDVIMRNWTKTLATYTPKEYCLQFCKIQASFPLESRAKSSKKQPENTRTFQRMGSFGCEFIGARDIRAQNGTAALRTQRIEAHIENMNNVVTTNSNTNYDRWESWESDQETIYNVI